MISSWRVRLWLLAGALALTAAVAWSASAAPSKVRIPRVRGDVVSVYGRLHALGLRVSLIQRVAFDASNPPHVFGTIPRAGRRVRRGSVVILLLARPRPRALATSKRLVSYRVPLLVGGDVSAAYGWVRHKRLIFRAYLSPLNGGNAPGLLANWRIVAQRPTPGSRLALGKRPKAAKGAKGATGKRPQPLRETPLSVWAVPRPPVATTGAAGSVTYTTAAIAGAVNPEGQATSAYFSYGPTTAYGRATPARQAGFGNDPVSESAALTELTAATTYHYRLVAHSSAGTVYGPDATFTTPGYYQNPVYGDAPMPDPFVLDNNGTHSDYWAYGTGDRFPILHSSDLVHWTPQGTAMSSRPTWVTTAPDWNPWAPSVLTSDYSCPGTSSTGCYVMYYVGLSQQLGVHCIGVATSPTPGGPFVDQGPLDLATGATPDQPLGCEDATGRGNIDPSPFIDPSGQAYLYVSTDSVCAGGSCTFKPTISVIPLSGDHLHAAGTRVPLFSGDPGTWEAASVQAPTVEGPSMELHNGTYYLFYSGGNWRAAYGMGYATSSSPTGPFTKAHGNPILAQTASVLSPGGGDQIVTGPHNGQWLVYHGRSMPGPPIRMLRIDPLTWTPNAGGPDTPVIAGPSATPQPTQP